MFEAHTLTAHDSGLSPQSVTERTYCRTHLPSLRPLQIWFAAGKRKDQQQQVHPVWFVYIEYRNDHGERQTQVLERPQSTTVRDLLKDACTTALDFSR